MKFSQKNFDDWYLNQKFEEPYIEESARWGFEQAKKLMLVKIKKEWKRLEKTDEKNMEVEQDYFNAFEWFKSILEGELK